MNVVYVLAFLTFSGLSPAEISEAQHVSAARFEELVAIPMGTMRYSEFVGVKDGKAFVIVNEMSSINRSWSRLVYWTDARTLSPGFRQRFPSSGMRKESFLHT